MSFASLLKGNFIDGGLRVSLIAPLYSFFLFLI